MTQNANKREPAGPDPLVYTALIAVGLVAPVLTFAIAVSELSSNAKVASLAAVAFVYFLICFWSYRKLREHSRTHAGDSPDDGLEAKLLALDEANEFFGSSLKPADTFRLVSSRIRDIYPFTSSVFFVVDASNDKLRAIHADGDNQAQLATAEFDGGRGLAGLAMLSGEVECSAALEIDRAVFPENSLDIFTSSAAIPLAHGDAVFGVVQLFSQTPLPSDRASIETLAAVGERIAPLLRGSIAFGESLSNALTDSVTNLPNERAFFLVLENQLAESMRSRDERPLSVLAIDIRNLDAGLELAGETERLLAFVSGVIRAQLRKMDFLARSISDEFLVILPTASDDTAREIVNRIMTAFAQTPFVLSGGDEIFIRVNFGCSCFWKDGETSQQLLQNARMRRQQAKAEESSSVVKFPKEYVN